MSNVAVEQKIASGAPSRSPVVDPLDVEAVDLAEEERDPQTTNREEGSNFVSAAEFRPLLRVYKIAVGVLFVTLITLRIYAGIRHPWMVRPHFNQQN